MSKFWFCRCDLSHPDAAALEEWISTKDFSTAERLIPKWHIPCDEEVQFANELLDIHFKSALDDLLKICQTKIHVDQGILRMHLHQVVTPSSLAHEARFLI